MASLTLDCWNNTLIETRLHEYIQNDPYKDDPLLCALNKPDGPKHLTPLGAACAKGHLDIVRLLIKKGADVNRASSRGRTPLWYATSDCPRKTRLSVVQALLQDPTFSSLDTPSTDSVGNTPLMNAIKISRDRDIVRLLVDKGAKMKMKNQQGKSAEELAKGTEFEKVLKGSTGLFASLAAIVTRGMALISYVILWVNGVRQVFTKDKVKEGVTKAYYKLTGKEGSSNNPEEKKAKDNVAVS